ncbi:hypothetical protein [Bradyrhizobium sp. 2S1]|uniref:hypothetical protein n=1 Tax=Bradyrhizobium sp. 2S1 TaxID=1404429 RepID=UPI00140D922C|nr:hypothetical protein [Bradyrhizobium sp. 2S1]MCK7672222.1 hypothetical protein [Bradyrhizobium sp. 2S1]
MSETRLRQMFDRASQFCEAHFAAFGEITPMWHAVTSSGETIIEQHPGYLGKDIAMVVIRAFFDAKDVVRYVYIGEAWTLDRMIEPGEQEAIMRDGLTNHPDRVEIVQLQGEDHECGQIMGQRKIIRPESGRPYLGPLQMVIDLPFVPDGATMQSEGRMVGVLPARGMRQ